MEDWGLQAIVRAGSCDLTNIASKNSEVGDCVGDFLGTNDIPRDDHDFLSGFSGAFDSVSGDELEELYKSFYPAPTFDQIPEQEILELKEELVQAETVEDKQAQTNHSSATLTSSNENNDARVIAHIPKYKKRKNQHKRVVIQVTAEELISNDVWAWRKYGQKPIKGSPYPRSYYRCSSSKGCLAKKHVEQSYKDPKMFIITYSGEHCHSQPTRRNSLAGTVRQKFPTAKVAQNTSRAKQGIRIENSTTRDCGRIKQESKDNEGDENEFGICDHHDMVMDDDFFSGLEDLDGLTSQIPFPQQWPVTFCT